MMKIGRRTFLQSAAAMGVPTAILVASGAGSPAMAAAGIQAELDNGIQAEVQREKAWAFFRSFYQAKDLGDAAGFASHFLNSDQTVYQDAIVGFNVVGYSAINSASFATGIINKVAAQLGAGRFSRVFHVTGDMRYGAIAEYVNLKDTLWGTNGFTILTMFDIDGGLIARDTDYWDSREFGESDIVGPAVTTGVAFPLGAIHPGGQPRHSPPPAPPGAVALATGVTGRPSASPEMLQFATKFHDALAHGSADDISAFFTHDATYVNPLIHQGPVLYPNFNQTLQLRGRDLIARLLKETLQWLPDCRGSTIIHVVGGASGGGFEWKAGGIHSYTGLDRTGLHGCTALDLFENKIQRMSVKFDTFQMSGSYYEQIRTSLRYAGLVDQ
ncbi:nuclear transport factor 2 family protein [Bradyrhizobium sp. Ash2021]|uniref:nuclear transport factor 2 family protein n=1 Tax=Bradyrhizobium sp. Ash2021 TaxID=2954771 RepID=UPI002815C136|nr:nuclear transport factor 2 family protein [Bradyrhizobium sp. Ash2021]WMT76408.1 nuclear transport factor 2 family protein [Bradyrhizobium sp. Ash2021]